MTIYFPKNGDTRSKWVFHGSFDAEGVLTYTDCVKTVEVLGEDGQRSSETQYSDGSGKLSFNNETERLTWKDEKEDVAKDLSFEKTK